MHLRSAAELNGSADCLRVALAGMFWLCFTLQWAGLCECWRYFQEKKQKHARSPEA